MPQGPLSPLVPQAPSSDPAKRQHPRSLMILDWGNAAVGDKDPATASDHFIAFNILVHHNVPLRLRSQGDDAYVIRRRFRQFASLHHALESSGFDLPDLPKVDIFTNLLIKFAPESALVERQDQLQVVLNAINNSVAMQATDAYADFIGQAPDEKSGYTSFSEYKGTLPLVYGRAKATSLPF
ncbi:Aste57867_20831 [Aphanomyces stellatus]|uniref:Aste57867_20831 protein n=1 Tax=Aphanomyces stellatus TaxID=120398 RepID=A0A485LKN5_9STRA|nr:hypothetical protein As57867_020763 [Aphanomyces stellatus]VFT97510.1 Aste57867_20831 [Aphanomyces stellatus]